MSNIISKIDELIEKPCYLIDIFPCTVPETADRRYFMVEEYFQKTGRNGMKNSASSYSNYIVIMTFGVHSEKNWRKIQNRMYLQNGLAIALRGIGRNEIISISSYPLAMQ